MRPPFLAEDINELYDGDVTVVFLEEEFDRPHVYFTEGKLMKSDCYLYVLERGVWNNVPQRIEGDATIYDKEAEVVAVVCADENGLHYMRL